MIDQTTRINAAISYFFMGPLMILSRKSGPFSHPFVQMHAKKSSMLLLIFLLIFLVFHFSQAYFVDFDIFWIKIVHIFLFAFNIAFFGMIFLSSYRAYRGEANEAIFWWESLSSEQLFVKWEYSEQQKAQIIAAFLLIFGNFSAHKNTLSEAKIGRKVSNFFTFFILFFAAITKSFIAFPVIFSIVMYVIVFASTSVFLMIDGRFLSLPAYRYIPSYHQLEAGIWATFSVIKDFFRVAFGGEKKKTFSAEYSLLLEKYSEKVEFVEKFWTNPAIIGLPIVNLVTIPSFFQKKYHEYQGNIAEGFLLTIFFVIFCFFANNILWLYFLIFPIVTLIIEGRNNANVRAPIVSIARNIFIFFYKTRKKIHALQETKIEEVVKIQHKNAKNFEKNENSENSEKRSPMQ